MQAEIDELKKQLPKRGAYNGIVKTNKQIRKKDGIQSITLSVVKNFFSGRSVSEDAQDAIIISTKRYLKAQQEKQLKRKKLLIA